MDRYARHSLIDWFDQEAISNTRAAVIGAGAVGNEVLKNLTLLGVGTIMVFDFDTIEYSNLTRSVLFRESDVGRMKAAVAAERAAELDPNVKVTAVAGDFWDTLSLKDIRSFDTVFCCVDNFEARIRLNMMCRIAGTDFVNVGLDSRYASVERFPFSLSEKTACYECNLPESVYARMAQRYSCGYLRKVSFVERKIPTTVITSAIGGAIATSWGLRMGSGSSSATRLLFDTIQGTSTLASLEPSGLCPCCAMAPTNAEVLRSGRQIGKHSLNLPEDVSIVLSEPILVGYTLPGEPQQILFQRAADFGDDFPATVSSTPAEVELEVRDQFVMSELTERFAGRDLPTKFAIVQLDEASVIFDFEEPRL